MKRSLLACLAVGASVLVAPAAHAGTSDVLHGGCFFETVDHPLVTGDTHTGVIGDRSVTTTGDSPPAPIGATVTCSIAVNGVIDPATSHSYGDWVVPGIQAGTDPLTYTAGRLDDVQLCEAVVYADSTSEAYCYPLDSIQIPPQTVVDTWNAFWDAFFSVFDPFVLELVEPLMCPPLASMSGNYGLVTIGPDGDVSVVDPLVDKTVQFVDCPPYVAPEGTSS